MSQEFANSGSEKATVRYSMYTDSSASLVGKTVRQVREQYGQSWEIDPQASAFIGKTQIGDDHIISQGDDIQFMRRQGEKGGVKKA